MPAVLEAVEDLGQALSGLADAAQMGHRLEAVVALDPGRDLDRPVAGRAARAVGDRDEVGLERLQRLDGLEQRLDALRRLGGKNSIEKTGPSPFRIWSIRIVG